MLRERTDRAWFSHLLWHLAKKWSGSILSTTEPTRGARTLKVWKRYHNIMLLCIHVLYFILLVMCIEASHKPAELSLGQSQANTRPDAMVDADNNLWVFGCRLGDDAGRSLKPHVAAVSCQKSIGTSHGLSFSKYCSQHTNIGYLALSISTAIFQVDLG